MKYLLTITTLYVLLSMSQAWSLPTCEGSYWDNCFGTSENYLSSSSPVAGKYVGEWKDGKYHQGTHTYDNGNKYVGEWKDWYYHGQGTLTWADGSKYVGEWKDGERDGQGTLTSPNGKVWQGQWEESEFVSGKKYAAGEYNSTKLKAEREAKLKAEREAEIKAEKKRKAKLSAFKASAPEEVKTNWGFRNIIPGMTSREIWNEAKCNINQIWNTCYEINNIKFSGTFLGEYLEVLYVDLGPIVETYSLSKTFTEIMGAEPSNIYEKTLKSLNKKYTREYAYNERDRQLFNEEILDQLLVVFNKGQVAIKIFRKRWETIDSYKNSLWLYVEYRGVESGKLFLEANRAIRETSDDF